MSTMKLTDLAGVALDATLGAPMVVLREREVPHRLLPIIVGGTEAAAIAIAVNGTPHARPLTHDLMAELLRSLDAHLDAVEVTEVRHGSFIAALAIHGPAGDQRIDTRPSDGIALAVRLGAPLFVAETLLDTDGIPSDVDLEEAAIDEEVAEFRSFLDNVDPSRFADTQGD